MKPKSSRQKSVTNLSLKCPKCRKRTDKEVQSYKTVITDVALVVCSPSFKYQTEIGTVSEFKAKPISSKRKFSPFKSPLTSVCWTSVSLYKGQKHKTRIGKFSSKTQYMLIKTPVCNNALNIFFLENRMCLSVWTLSVHVCESYLTDKATVNPI